MADQVHVDRAVARRILGGDEAAFRELFDRFFPRLYRFALARLNGDAETARDVVAALYRRGQRGADGVVLLEDQPNARAILEALAAPASDEPETGVWREQGYSLRVGERRRAPPAGGTAGEVT